MSSIWTSSCCCAAREWIGVGPHAYSRDGADHPHPDLWFVDDEQTSYLALQPGDFAIFWPENCIAPLHPDDPRSGQEAGRQGSPVAADRRLSGTRGLGPQSDWANRGPLRIADSTRAPDERSAPNDLKIGRTLLRP